jgi:hypothetical protein
VFCDDYTDPSLAGDYTTHQGTWTRSAGQYQGLDSVAWERARATLAYDATDFDVTLAGHTLGDSGLGLVYDASATADDGYAVIVHPAQFQGVYLKKLNPGASDTDLATYALPTPLAGQPLLVRIQRAGTQVTVWLNGAQVLSASDDSPGDHGRLGLLVSTTDQTAGAGADFTLLRVDALTPWSMPDAGSGLVPTTTVDAERANNTAASPRFLDDYANFETFAQSGNSNGDFVPGPTAATDLTRGRISKVPLSTLLPAGAPTLLLAETQTWFCHLATNETTLPDGGAGLVHGSQCGSHIDVGYNSDDPAHVHLQVEDLLSRGLSGVIMDWSGKETPTPSYPTTQSPPTTHSRPSTEVCTNAVYAYQAEAESRPAGQFTFAVVEDEGITNCRNGWAGGCACWPAYSSICDVTSQVISDLNYIGSNWAGSPAYLQLGGGPAVFFFSPDYNACPDPSASDCQHIDWAAVRQYAPANQQWIFENKGGFGHADSAGGFAWLSTGPYPTGDTSYGANYLDDFDAFVVSSAGSAQVVDSVFKGFDDGVTNGWSYSTTQNNTRYINQRCGQTWLDTFALHAQRFDGPGLPDLEAIQVVTWDDYEEATEVETGIDTCLQAIDLSLNGSQLTWSLTYGASLTDASISGSENTVDHFQVFASTDGVQLAPLGAPLTRDAQGNLPHALDLSGAGLPSGSYTLYVEAVGKPSLSTTLSDGLAYTAP